MKEKEKVIKLIRETGMLKDGDRVLAGVSGGADSVFLFYVLKELTLLMKIELHVIHVHHGIRGSEADRDARFVEKMCAGSGIPEKTVRRDIPREAGEKHLSLEEAGRAARLEILTEEAEALGGAVIALAHHRDDLAETVLFRIARGTGIRGLGAMRAKNGPFIRPLLGLTKREICGALVQAGIPWVEDGTNAEDDAVRNRIRHTILPLLKEEVNERAAEHLAELAECAAEAADFISAEAGKKEKVYVRTAAKDTVILAGIMEEHPAVRREILYRAISRAGGSAKDVSRYHILSAEAIFEKNDGAALDLPHGLICMRNPSGIRIAVRENKSGMAEKPEDVAIERIPGVYTYGKRRFSFRMEGEAPWPVPEKRYTKWLDYDKIKSTLSLRTRRPGDYITIDGEGRKKKLSDWFTDQKVPVSKRDTIPLLVMGHEVIWITGMRIGYRFRVEQSTEHVLLLESVREESEDIE